MLAPATVALTFKCISIHALLAESDFACAGWFQVVYNFYPRSPCGERPFCRVSSLRFFWYFYPRSPCGERRHQTCQRAEKQEFLSTLSLRRATFPTLHNILKLLPISIHALLAESDVLSSFISTLLLVFLSTLSLRRATIINTSLFMFLF